MGSGDDVTDSAPLVVIVTGSRHVDSNDWQAWKRFSTELEDLRAGRANDGSFGMIIGDNPKGWDRFALEYARATRTPYIQKQADWGKLGAAAGPARNGDMIEEGRIRAGLGCRVFGFAGWDGRRTKCGTLDAMEQMVKAGFNGRWVAV